MRSKAEYRLVAEGAGPPKIPSDFDSMTRAIVLLGERQSKRLTPKRQLDLVELVGSFPTPEQAACWKRILKQERAKRLAEAS